MRKSVIVGIGSFTAFISSYAMYQRSRNNDQEFTSSGDSNRSDMKLKLVQVVFRHGARTPLSPLDYLPTIEYHDDLLKHDHHTFIPYTTKALDGSDSDIKQSIYKHKDKMYGFEKHGELTSKGAEQMYQLGCQLKKRYITDLEFLPCLFTDAVTVRSTSVKRAVESARCTLAGLFFTKHLITK